MSTQIVEIGGTKFAIDATMARVVTEYTIGMNVKVLVKTYSSYNSYPGVVVGFDNFKNLPTVMIAYLEPYDGKITFVALNENTKDVEICAMTGNELPFDKERVVDMLNRNIEKAEFALTEAKTKRDYFVNQFAKMFKVLDPEAATAF